MKIMWDVDGVVRDLITPMEMKYNFKARHWNFTHNGKDFWDMAEEIPDLFLNAPSTPYYEIIKQIKSPTFWTIQRPEYKDQTLKWLDNHFDNYKIRFFKDFKHKENAVYKKDIILVDDFPNFSNYSNILLIDTEYNKQTKAKKRIKTPEQLQKVLDNYL